MDEMMDEMMPFIIGGVIGLVLGAVVGSSASHTVAEDNCKNLGKTYTDHYLLTCEKIPQ